MLEFQNLCDVSKAYTTFDKLCDAPITLTCPCNEHPGKPQFVQGTVGFKQYSLSFILAQKHRSSSSGSNGHPQSVCRAKVRKISSFNECHFQLNEILHCIVQVSLHLVSVEMKAGCFYKLLCKTFVHLIVGPPSTILKFLPYSRTGKSPSGVGKVHPLQPLTNFLFFSFLRLYKQYFSVV